MKIMYLMKIYVSDSKWSVFQVYHSENKLRFDEHACFLQEQYAELDFYFTSSMKQQSLR
jgi:hypothetical protein